VNKTHIAAQRIALRYISEKIDHAYDEAQTHAGMDPETLETFHGWFLEYADFKDWMDYQGYNKSLSGVAWAIIQTLLGIERPAV
jgi:hypothetical protein